MDSQVEDVKSRLNIVDVVGGYLRLTKSGAHWKAHCPFHNEKTPSFMVNEERQIWHCFGCGKGGDVFSFVEEIEGVGFCEALEMLAERVGVELRKYRSDSALDGNSGGEPLRIREILELATKFYEKQLWDGMGRKNILPYLHNRGLTDESIRTFRLGYAPKGWRHLYDFLISRGYRVDELEKAGLVIRKDRDFSDGSNSVTRDSSFYDRFRDRIMFPITDIVGRVIGYSARVAPGGDESQAKYINTPETEVYHKSKAIYGIYQAKQAIKEAGFAVLVEGQMDTIACHQAGIRNTVAVSGTALTAESRDENRWYDNHLDMLKRYAKETRLFFDMDGAGQMAAWKSALSAYEKELQVSIVSLPHGKDAADAALEDVNMLREAINHPTPAARYFLDRLLAAGEYETPDGKRRVAEGYAPLLVAMRNPLERAHWMRELASALGVEEKMLSGVVEDERSRGNRADRLGNTTTEKPDEPRTSVFSRRSDTLRERILGILLVRPEAKDVIIVDESVSVFLHKHPLAKAAFSGGDPLLSVSSEDEKQRVAKILFEAEEFLDGISEGEEYGSNLDWTLRGIGEDLRRELRKEALGAITRKMEEARKRGDLEGERKLAEEFSRLSSGN